MASDQQTTDLRWSYDPARRCWDGEAPDGRTACVARDGNGAMPWGAWYATGGGPGNPDSWHRTMREAQAACAKGLPA